MPEIDSPEAQEKIEELKNLLREQSPPPEEKGEDVTGPVPMDSSPIKGSDVDWSEYDLDPNFAHFYPKAELLQDGDTFKWVVGVFEFYSFSAPYNGQGVDDKGRPKGFGGMLTYLINGPEKWQIAQILPNGAGLGAAVLQRRVLIHLPNPPLIETKTTVDKPTDEEIAAEETRALDWLEKADKEAKDIRQETTDGLQGVNDPSGAEQSL